MSDKRTEVLIPMTLEELQALSDKLHDRGSIRFNPDNPWTAEKSLAFRTRIDAELALLVAERLTNPCVEEMPIQPDL